MKKNLKQILTKIKNKSSKKKKEVAVKVLRPRIRQRFKRDISFLFFVARIGNYFQILRVEVVRTFEKTSLQELDLRYEAAANQLAETLNIIQISAIP